VFRPLPILTVATLVALAVLVGLGLWQLQRRDEKHALLAQIAARSAAPPASIEILLASGDYAAYRPATARGRFDPTRASYVYAPRSDPPREGFKLIMPFNLASDGTILVDRGWVSAEWRSRKKDPAAEPEDEVEIAGTLRPSAKPGAFTPAPDSASRTFYQRDSAAIAHALGLTLRSPLVLEATTRVKGGPEPLPPAMNIPDNHLMYALTWFFLAAVLVAIYLRYHYVRDRLRFGR